MEQILIYIVVALVSFTLGAGSLRLVESRRDGKERQARERQLQVNWNIHEQIENNVITDEVKRLKNDAAKDRSRYAILNQRVCELEGIIKNFQLTPADFAADKANYE